MKNMIYIAKHNFKLFFNSRLSLVLLVMPVLTTLLLVAMISQSSFTAKAQVGVVVEEETTEIKVLLDEMSSDLSLIYLDRKAAMTKLEQKKLNGILIISSNHLLNDLRDGKKSIEIMGIEDDYAVDLIAAKLQSALTTMRQLVELSGGEESELERLYASYKNELIEMSVDQTDLEMTKAVIIFGMFVMIFLFTCTKSLQAMIAERESKAYERICISPIKGYEYILGHILGAFTVLLIQIVIQGMMMRLFVGTFGLNLPIFIGICVILGIVGIALSLILVACTQNTQTYYIAGCFIISPLCMISGGIFPKEFLPDLVNRIAVLSPVWWIMTLYKGVITGAEIKELLMSTGITLGIAMLLILMGIVIENTKRVSD